MGIYQRPGSRIWWMRYKTPDGRRMWQSTQQVDETSAREVYEGVLAALRGEKPTSTTGGSTTGAPGAPDAPGPMTVRRYAAIWLADRRSRELESVDDDEARLEEHVFPVLGDVVLADLRRTQVREFARGLKKRISRRTKRPLATRTQHHVYDVLRQLCRDAMAEERIAVDPCVLKRGDLAPKRDADPAWRPTAVFDTREVALLISHPEIPMDRRIWYALHFLTGMRPGEGAATRWQDLDPRAKPLGRIVCARAYDRKRERVKGTKTEQVRYLPVHQVLAELLAEWKAGPWQEMLREWRAIKNLPDAPPGPEDLIIPSRRGAPRSNSTALKRFKQDLERLGLRVRRAYDTRRTFASLTQAGGASPDVVRWLTHPPTDMLSKYTTLPWSVFCDAVSCWKIRRLSPTERQGILAELLAEATEAGAAVENVGDSSGTDAARQEKTAASSGGCGGGSARGVRDSKLGPRPQSSAVEHGAVNDSERLRAKLRAMVEEAGLVTVSTVSEIGRRGRARGGVGGRERVLVMGAAVRRSPR